MQDMSCLFSDHAITQQRLLRSDTALSKSSSDTHEPKTKVIPKIKKQEPVDEHTTKNLAPIPKIVSEDKRISSEHKITSQEEKDIKSENLDQADFACKVCSKVLSSNSSLERHMLVHSGDRPFRCKMCDLTFTTNGNMHRHSRTHKKPHDQTDSDDSDDGGPSCLIRTPVRKRRIEFNNNDDKGGDGPGGKKKSKNADEDNISGAQCPVCGKSDFTSSDSLDAHVEKEHPEHRVECSSCNSVFKDRRGLNLHRYIVHRNDAKPGQTEKISGFNDCTFVDFSSEKFPQIARSVCEKSIHKSVTDQKFKCKKCSREFPCESALDIHSQDCSIKESGDIKRVASDARRSSSSEEDVRRDDFFANLDLQNRSPHFVPIAHIPLQNGIRKPKTHSDFFANRDEPVRPPMDNSKDLADIQSILSVTSTCGLLERLARKTHDNERDDISQSEQMNRSGDDHEEVQDVFASEFRKMKLRGEFPCRLCTAIFPNLRALKGHNRVHLSGNGPGPYRCNMCPQSSLDKAALVRHMRTHNGDRPYECAVCNYAFTTKANCERHLRNRHSKVTREDVKRSIIYHPSEDPNNDDVNSKLNIPREDMKRTLIFNTPEMERHHDDSERITHSDRLTPVSHYTREPAVMPFNDHGITIPLPRELSIMVPQPREIMRAHCSIDPVVKAPLAQEPELIQPRIKVKGFGQLTQIPDFEESDIEREMDSEDEDEERSEISYVGKPLNYSIESPMDLSTTDCQDNVLDLSKKKNDKPVDERVSDAEPEEYIPKTIEFNNNHAAAASMFEKTQQLALLAQQQLLKGQYPKLDNSTGFYANQLSQLYRGAAPFPGLALPPTFPLNPYFLQHPHYLAQHANPQEIAEMKERIQKEIIRGLQMSGGGLVGMDPANILNNMERLQAFHQHNLNRIASPDVQTPSPVIKLEEDLKPQLSINTDTPTTIPFANPMLSSPKLQKKEVISGHSPNSVKMVIKNGVLMPKQKQRRYRTERPFSCEHCSARFTLRSNMERHIKQQHPHYWSQRQRTNIGTLPRKNPVSIIPQNITVPSINYESRLNFIKNINPSPKLAAVLSNDDKETTGHNPHEGVPMNKAYSMISDQVKYAILAQQLKSQNHLYNNQKDTRKDSVSDVVSVSGDIEEEDEEDALVIDEETSDDKSQVSKELDLTTNKSPLSEPIDVVTLTDSNSLAKKVAEKILIDVSAKTNDISKDFDWKIAGSLISKNINAVNSVIPTFVTQIGNPEKIDDKNSPKSIPNRSEEGDLVPVSRLLDNAVTQLPFGQYFKNDFSSSNGVSVDVQRRDAVLQTPGEGSEEDEEGLVASSGSTSEGNNSGSDENRSESETTAQIPQKKKSAYSLAPNRVSCQYCHRKFPWSSSLRRHILTHTGQKPFKCPHCPLLFTTKSNCDRHLLRKHGGAQSNQQRIQQQTPSQNPPQDVVPTPQVPPSSTSQGFMMRNVPERPYKCAGCPSSTFSTLGNLKKHMSSKHGIEVSDRIDGDESLQTEVNGYGSRPESRDGLNADRCASSDDEKASKCDDTEVMDDKMSPPRDWESQINSSKFSPSRPPIDGLSNTQNCDLPFKCHLCEGSYGERQDALDHIKASHNSEYELLMSKGALESGVSLGFGEDLGSSAQSGHGSEGGEEPGSEENIEQLRGKFPDYANRKVVCAFCMRRFWSAEDLRRHMRTHTGERPFSCDVCRRRFTLKHSMLRHRKKHTGASSSSAAANRDLSATSGDEENCSKNSNRTFSPSPSNVHLSSNNTSTPISTKLEKYHLAINDKCLSHSPEIPSNVNNNNSPPGQIYEGKVKMQDLKEIQDNIVNRNRYSSEDNEGTAGNDLIGNLLGISDLGIINKLLSSPDEAAKLLGVNDK